jgi:phospholipase C
MEDLTKSGNATVTVSPPAPSNLVYPQTTILAIAGQGITPDIPTVTGTVNSYSVSPALPAGLSINTTTGTISGTPNAAAAQAAYTVSATNLIGSASETLQITVAPAAPSNLVYPQTAILAIAGQAITPNVPTVTGTVSFYSVSPALPAGLSFNTTTGTISGTPTATAAQATFTVVAANVTGFASETLQITVGPASSSPIQHVIVIIQENRSFDNLFNGFPGADSVQSGMSNGTVVPLSPVPLAGGYSLDNSHLGWWKDWDSGQMDGFARNLKGNPPLYEYSYVQQSDIQPYWDLATQYTLADEMFQSNTGPSFPAHQYLIAGQSGDADEDPSGGYGCDSPAGTTVALIGPNGTDLPGVFPCFDYQTMADLLDAKGITWRYYAYAKVSGFEAYEAIRQIFYGSDYPTDIIAPQTQVLTDIGNGELAQVTWITPDLNHSDHPAANKGEGPDWVASIVNAVGESPFWNSTAIFITWDDWGGWYDHVVPPVIDNMGPGFRVPLIVVSPYAKPGYISHQQYESASFLTFMENNFNLPNLGTRDATANDLSDCFDYSQTAIPFTEIKHKVSADTILHEAPSGAPDDD